MQKHSRANEFRRKRVTSRLFLGSIVFIFLNTFPSFGQPLPRFYDAIALADPASFLKVPANWTYADSLLIHPEKPNSVRTIPGKKYLVGKPGESLLPKFNARNFRLFLGYVLSPGASALLTLPGGATILLSEGRNLPEHVQSGFTGLPPIQDAGKMAGLLQTVELDYESFLPSQNGKVRINELKINGIVVQQGQYLTHDNATPLSLQVIQGTIGVNRLGYREFEDRRPIRLQNLTYKIYNDDWDSRTTNLLGESGSSPELTYQVADGKKTFNLVYEGDLIVEEDGDYDFMTIYTGAYCQLSIDENVVLDTDNSNSQEVQDTNVRLEKGNYRVKLWYSKLPWANAALGLRVGKSGIRPYDLHAKASLPEPPAKPFITVSPGKGKAEMVRSFVQLPFENHKRTHCISVGSPLGRNYTLDLNRGALLQVWKGRFANTTEMWHQRGERQLLIPVGQNEILSGRSSIARLNTADAPWTDSSAVNFLDYRVNDQGELTFRFALGPSLFQDAVSATESGLQRTITPERNASTANYVLLAEGYRITQIEKGLYVVDGKYYIKTKNGASPLLRKNDQLEELIAPLASPLSYSILW